MVKEIPETDGSGNRRGRTSLDRPETFSYSAVKAERIFKRTGSI
ncbi:MAG TPA: hypothetical protein PLR20_04285 [Syntrophales bacterium]|nr:hypothetical protein [Syntrophales bacterium]HQM28552.1 hypothetical protein [Syntrophales bacterium]